MTARTRHPLFPQEEHLIYLNHAAISPWSSLTANAVRRFADQNSHSGSKHYLQWLEIEGQLRELLRQLINADSVDDIALLKNTSEGLSIIAYGIDWNDGDNIVIPAGEFPSNRIVWESLQQFGVETRHVDIFSTVDPEKALFEATDNRTRLISVSAVQYHNGFRLSLEKIGTFCRQHDILFVVDAIQQLGALSFDNSKIGADYIIADGHKWMMGAEGLALFYSSKNARPLLNLKQYGWRMVENSTDFNQSQWTVTNSAKRFECGSPNMLGIITLHASLELLMETGIDTIEKAILAHTQSIIDYITQHPNYELLSDIHNERRSGIICFRHRQQPSEQLFTTLTRHGIQCAMRGHGIRFSPHFYHQAWEFEQLFGILDGL